MPIHVPPKFNPRQLGARCDTCILGPNGPYYTPETWAPVPPELRREALVILIGEAPGEHEVKSGRPFVGRSGEWLALVLRLHGHRRDDVSITNACLCRPVDNRLDRALRRAASLTKRRRDLERAMKRAERALLGKHTAPEVRFLAACVHAAGSMLLPDAVAAWREDPIVACNAENRLSAEIARGARLGPGGHRYVVPMGNHALREVIRQTKALAGQADVPVSHLHISTFRGSPLVLDDAALRTKRGRMLTPMHTTEERT